MSVHTLKRKYVMATNANTTQTTAKAPKVAKPQVPQSVRITDQMKRAALQGKLSAADCDALANLATSLKVFVATP
jgi:hypothetical protein